MHMNISNINLLDLFLIIVGVIIFGFLIFAAIVSVYEKEKKAAGKFFFLSLIVTFPYFLTGFVNFPFKLEVSIALLALIVILVIIYIVPFRTTSDIIDTFPKGRIDERKTMFSRNELKKGSVNYIDFYNSNPDKFTEDEKFRIHPGLLAEGSVNFDPFMFSAADASFFTVDALKNKVDGEVSPKKILSQPVQITNYIKNWAKKLGALEVGITKLEDYHKYSHRGRGEYYGEKVELDHKYAIAFTVEMDVDAVRSGPYGPIVMESAQQYLESGAIAVQLAEFIRKLGYPARAHIDGNYEVVCPLIAKDAGLGELGRMGLLMTPKLGPRVRIAVVTTDMPLDIDARSFDPTVTDFCSICKKCANVCPSNAISLDDRVDINGVLRWQINQESCFNLWTIVGTDCGRCMSVCPYSHPDNLLHNIVRVGIRNSAIFSRLALLLDDAIYGSHPPSIPPTGWMKVDQSS